MKLNYLFFLSIIFIFVNCQQDGLEESSSPLFQKLNSENTGIDFVNKVLNTEQFNIFSYRNFYNGGGVAMGDVNQDGLADLYFTNNMGANRLYLNKGDLQFEDITTSAGVASESKWSTGVVMVDLNYDGLLDIYVCNAGYLEGENQENQLYINNGDLTFTEKAAEYNLNENGYTTHTAFFDYDMDGDLDAYILNNSFIPVNTLNYSNKRELKADDWPVKDFLKGGGDKLLRNDVNKFVDVTEEAGIYSSLIGFGLGVTIGDVNGDHMPDIYVSNDFFERDYLYINSMDAVFTEELKDYMQHISLSSMGADMADINNDGYTDIFVSDMLPDDDYRLKTTSQFESYSIYDLKQKRDFYQQFMHNTLQFNNKDQTFTDIAFYAGVAASDWSWGALMFDADNDGLRDIYVCNGIYQDVTDQDFIDFFANDVVQKMALTGEKEEFEKVVEKMPSNPIVNKAFKNENGMQFSEVSTQCGFTDETFSNGAVYGDLDNDGDLDLVVSNVNQEALVYENRTDQLLDNHYIKIKLKGLSPNTYAIGSKIKIYAKDQIFNTELIPSRGFQSSIDYTTIIGLGKETKIDSMVIVWPDFQKTILDKPVVDSFYQINYYKVDQVPLNCKTVIPEPLLTMLPSDFDKHTEDAYTDFYHEGLLIKKLSNEGPAMASGDINGDGKEDLIIGGANNQATQVYLQAEGTLEKIQNKGLESNRDFEDATAALFDADGDGDLDLIMGSGGNHRPMGDRQLQDRLYLNDGLGQFKLKADALPTNGYNTSIILPFDYDEDGDEDLFIGSRSIPFDYGVNPRSYIYRNDGNARFTDVTKFKAPDISRLGLVTDAVLADISGNGKNELIIIGEWMSPVVFSIKESKFEQMDSNLDEFHGWWRSVVAEDMDNDGDIDLIIGNQGENFYLQGTKDAPLKLWLSDFDDNKTTENIVTRTHHGRDVTISLKRELMEQLVNLKKTNTLHEAYANKSIQELMSPEELKSAEVKKANYMSSCIAYNEGNGKFKLVKLPAEAQLSCINDIICVDLNHDDRKDLILGGNDFGYLPQFSRQDGINGLVLINNSDEDFLSLSRQEAGIDITGQVRKMQTLNIDNKVNIVIGINNETPLRFQSK